MKKNNSYIHIENLSKSYGYKKVLNSLNLSFDKGEIVAIFGPNGAGKTTLIRILSTLIKKDEGQINIAGFDISEQVTNIRRIVGLLSHESFLYHNLTVLENLKFFGKLYKTENLDDLIFEKLERFGIENKKDELVRSLSSGTKQRVSIIRSLIHNPEIIFFDEPFVGLDIEGVSLLKELLNDLKNDGKTVFVTTHDLKLILNECSSVVVLYKGYIKLYENTNKIDIADFENTYRELIRYS